MKVLHSYTIRLTEKQADAIDKQWCKHAKGNAWVIGQPYVRFGPFRHAKPIVEFTIVDNDAGLKIQDVINKAKGME